MPTVPIPSLRSLIAATLSGAGAPEDLAGEVADVLIDNHLAGHDSHGVLRVPQYVAAIEEGALMPSARPVLIQDSDVTAMVSGEWGFGQVGANYAADIAIDKAERHGVAAVALVQVGHTGRLAAFTERGVERDVALFMTVGSGQRPRTAPYGGTRPVLGTNPISFALPNHEGPPVTLDYATSGIALGKVKVAQSRNAQLPEGAALTADGRPTTDPEEYAQGGFLLPFGGHKGYALAVMAEVLSGALIGADAYARPGGRSTGAFFFAVSVAAFRPASDYQAALSETVARITAVPAAEGFDRVAVPGEPEAQSRRARRREGIDVPDSVWDSVCDVARRYGVDVDSLA